MADVTAFRKGLSEESDRGCALFATAYLEKALSDLLFVSVVYGDTKKMERDLFEFNSPLGTFSSRIKMAYYLGKISKVTRRELDLLRNIRNRFAHHPTTVSFDDEAVANQCRELRFTYRERSDAPRLLFTGSVVGVLAQIHGATYAAEAPQEKPDDAPTDKEKADHREKQSAAQRNLENDT
ncbi:MAG: MltR family transcriptional regulator [Gammaproteobacteria bacterium]